MRLDPARHSRPLDYAPPELNDRVPWRCSIAFLAALAFVGVSVVALAPGLHNEHPFLPIGLIGALVGTVALAPALRHARRLGPGRGMARAAVVLWTIAASVIGLAAYGAVFGEDPHVTTRRWNYCTSRLRTIGQAMTLYANDHERKYPDSLADLLRATPDMTSESFVCPAVVPYSTPAASREGTIAELASGKNQQHIYLAKGLTDKVTPETVLVHDNPANWSAHGGGVGVLLGDMSSFQLEQPEAAKLLAELAAGHNPPRPDHFKRP